MKKNKCNCGLCSEAGCICEPYSRFFSVLGSTTRLHIINALRKGPKNVSELMEKTGLEQTCISHCLSLLMKTGFVSCKPKGKYRIYSLNSKAIEPLMELIDDHVRKHCSLKM